MEALRNTTAGTAASPALSTKANRAVADWAANTRKLSAETLGLLGVASGVEFFPDLGRRSDAIVFRFAEGRKARAVPDKSFVAGGGFKLAFWNLERVLKGPLAIDNGIQQGTGRRAAP